MSYVLKDGLNIVPAKDIDLEVVFGIGSSISKLLSDEGVEVEKKLSDGEGIVVYLMDKEIWYTKDGYDMSIPMNDSVQKALDIDKVGYKIGKVLLNEVYLYDYIVVKDMVKSISISKDADMGDLSIEKFTLKGFKISEIANFSPMYSRNYKSCWLEYKNLDGVITISNSIKGNYLRIVDDRGKEKVYLDSKKVAMEDSEKDKILSNVSIYLQDFINIHSITVRAAGFTKVYVRDSRVKGEFDVLFTV
jgi:hypothetical protein